MNTGLYCRELSREKGLTSSRAEFEVGAVRAGLKDWRLSLSIQSDEPRPVSVSERVVSSLLLLHVVLTSS